MGQYYSIYERKGRDLIHITDVQGITASQALTSWTDDYGDNYGKVVVLPHMSVTIHNHFEYRD